MRSTKKKEDPRGARTRRALLEAFSVEVLSRPYEDITVDDIARRGGISRSTFYQHFASKNALLAESLGRVFKTLADALGSEDNSRQLTAVLEHFWENRALSRALLSGSMRRHAVEVLAALVQRRFGRNNRLIVPSRIAALQIADSLLSPVGAWLAGEAHCPATRLACALRASGVSLMNALRA